jgi:energy-coupling factor transporter ATP-binding protein EcfA2
MSDETVGTAEPAAVPQAAPAVQVAKPLKIKSFTLCDFRAFAGPEPITFNLDGKNLLIYGENGAGKSSVFHALDQFFSVADRGPDARKQRLLGFKNIFSGRPDAELKISVEFDDGVGAAEWTTTRHPVDIAPNADARVKNAAYRKAILDYRALLDTNYRHGSGAVNLFDVCINVLLRDYQITHNGREERLYDLWRRLNEYLERGQIRQREKNEISALSVSFNQGLQAAIARIRPIVDSLLVDLGWDDIKLAGLTAPGIAYNGAGLKQDRGFGGREVTPALTFRGSPVSVPQTFLNEARLSALALAIYFAGRQVCADTLQADTPRLIVLDDVLIGLDQSNRMPVLRMLDKHFADWQIVLLTHDRVWYEMARFHLADRVDWNAVEMFEEKQPNGAPMPIVKPASIDPVVANVATARKFHALNEYAAAAVHARVAFELSLKKLCDRKGIPVRFKTDPRQLSSDDLLSAVEAWLSDSSKTAMKALVNPSIIALKLWRKVVLNPFSHSTPVSLAGGEVKGAIDAVEALHKSFKDHIPK